MPDRTSVKVIEPPPRPPVLATLLAEIHGPDPETRCAVASRVREAFESVPYIVDVDVFFFGVPARRLRIAVDEDRLQFVRVEHADVFETLGAYFGGMTVGYSHRGKGRRPILVRIALAKGDRVMDERALATPVPANLLPGDRSIVELGDVVSVRPESTRHPIFRHNMLPAEMVTAELAGAFEAPVYGMIAVAEAIDAIAWGDLQKPVVRMNGRPEDEGVSTPLWDGEWEVTWVTFRDMGTAFMVALLGIYILVVAQFGSFKLPLVILTPVPLTLIGIVVGHWLFDAPFSATSMIGLIALAGIIVRNSILLVDFVSHNRNGEMRMLDVLLEAGAIRFKTILLTAMIGAAVILTDPIFQGLTISLLFGLASSTVLTVLVRPAIYIVLRGPDRIYGSRPAEA